jgi:hypothetical protein
MSFILSGIAFAGVGYYLYKYMQKGTTHDPPTFRDPYLRTDNFEIDPIITQVPHSNLPPPAYQKPADAPSLVDPDKFIPSVHLTND